MEFSIETQNYILQIVIWASAGYDSDSRYSSRIINLIGYVEWCVCRVDCSMFAHSFNFIGIHYLAVIWLCEGAQSLYKFVSDAVISRWIKKKFNTIILYCEIVTRKSMTIQKCLHSLVRSRPHFDLFVQLSRVQFKLKVQVIFDVKWIDIMLLSFPSFLLVQFDINGRFTKSYR